MTAPFNPFAGNFSSIAWLAPDGDYRLKILGFSYKNVGNDNPKPVVNVALAIADGEFINKRVPQFQVWEPEVDFTALARILVAAKGFNPGKQDKEFAEAYGHLDLSLDHTQSENGQDLHMGSGYKEFENDIIEVTLSQKDDKNGIARQQFKMIRPISVQE